MKKIVALVLVLALCLTAVSVMAEGEGTKVKIGFIFLHDENSTYDLNFINGAKEACEKLGVEYVLKTNIGAVKVRCKPFFNVGAIISRAEMYCELTLPGTVNSPPSSPSRPMIRRGGKPSSPS